MHKNGDKEVGGWVISRQRSLDSTWNSIKLKIEKLYFFKIYLKNNSRQNKTMIIEKKIIVHFFYSKRVIYIYILGYILLTDIVKLPYNTIRFHDMKPVMLHPHEEGSMF